jgi:hypothetical protein
MLRIALHYLNAPVFVLLMILGVAVQTSLFLSYPLDFLQPDLLLLGVLWCGLRRPFFEGGVLTLILGEIAEVHSTAPSGLFLTTYMAIYLLTRVINRFVALPFHSSLVLLAMAMSLLWKGMSLVFLASLGLGWTQWRHTLSLVFPGAAVEGLTAYWLLRFFAWFDIATYKNEKARRSMEEQVHLAEEGL